MDRKGTLRLIFCYHVYCILLLFCGVSSGSSSSIRAIARSIVALEDQSVNLRCIPAPFTTSLRWTFGGRNLPSTGMKYKLGRLSQTLTINNLTMEDSGDYNCHVVGADDVTAAINLNVKKVDCLPSIAGGLIWDGQSAGRTSVRRCSDLHSVFNSGLTVSRKCSESGKWMDTDFSACTMRQSLHRNVIVMQTEVYKDIGGVFEFEMMVLRELNTVDVVDYNTIVLPNKPQLRNVSVAVVVSVERMPDLEFSEKLIPIGSGNIDPNSITTVPNGNASIVQRMYFLHSLLCECSGPAVTDLTVIHVCVGPGVPPCTMKEDGYQCNAPIYSGGSLEEICGLDSDGDTYPDFCHNQCETNLCLDVSSYAHCRICSCTESSFPVYIGDYTDFSGDYPVFSGDSSEIIVCPSETDDKWLIDWPATTPGSVATRRCNGIDADGFVSRRCTENGTWDEVLDVINCYSIELSRLQDDTRQLNTFYFGDDDADEIDYTQSLSVDDLNPSIMIRGLNSHTNSTNPIVPRDLNVANDILNKIVRILEFDESDDVTDIAMDLSSTISNLLNDSNMVTYEFDKTHQSNDNLNEAEVLFNNIESFASIFRSLAVTNHLQNMTFSDRNFDINFEVISMSDLQSSNGVEFKTENSQIFIPNSAIMHQMEKEATGTQLPVVNYAAQNLASVLPERSLGNATIIDSEVISSQISSGPISLPPDGYVTLTFKLEEPPEEEPRCVFWDFNLTIGNTTGGWSEEGVFLDVENTNSTTITCVTNHLTSFAVLFQGAKKRIFGKPNPPPNGSNISSTNNVSNISNDDTTSSHDEALSLVSFIGCGISIICLLATIVIILLFRKTIFKLMQNMIHVNLSLALLLGLILFVSGIETARDNKAACIVVTVLLHYFFLAAFCWMLCEGIIIYMLLVKVFYQGLFSKLPIYMAIGWGVPVPIVAITAGISHDHYGIYDVCWLPSVKGIIWSFIAPVILIIMCNTVILVISIRALYTATKRRVENHQMNKITMSKKLIKASIFLLPTLGVTWIFRVIAVNSEQVAFAWIFTILNSVEGLFIFVFYVLQKEQFIEKVSSCLGIRRRKHEKSSSIKMTSKATSKKSCQSITLEASTDLNQSDQCSITDLDVEADHKAGCQDSITEINEKSPNPSNEGKISDIDELTDNPDKLKDTLKSS